jgi:cytochrome c5
VISKKAASVGHVVRTAGKVLMVLLAVVATYSSAAVEDEIRARIQPAGTVCVLGDPCAAGLSAGGAAGGAAKDPETVYNTFCMACHATGANNAPMLGNKEAWAPRIAKGIDVLYQSALNGFNNGAMPPKGLCMDCTEDEIKATVDHIVSQSQ